MPNSSSNDSIIAVLLTGMAVFFIAWTYVYHFRHYDRVWARLLAPRRLGWGGLIIAFSLGANLVNTLPGGQAKRLIMWLFLILFIGTISITAFRRRQRIPALLDLGVVQPASEALVALVGVGAIAFFVAALVDAEHRETLFIMSGYCACLAVMGTLSRQSRTVLNETGIYLGTNVIRWLRIKRFGWNTSQTDPVVLMVQVAGRVPPLDVEEIRVPAAQRGTVEQFLAKYAPIT